MTRTAVVILSWNGLAWLQKFLGTVVAYSSDNDTIVYVADNGSSDGSAAWISQNWPSVKLITLDKNYGFAGGYNIALSKIDARYYILLNSDVEVTPGWLKPLVDCLEQNPDVAACQPKIKSYQNRDFFEYAGAAGGFIDKYGFTFCRGRIFGNVEKDEGQYDDNAEIFWSSGACLAVKKEQWDKCGGLDSEFFAHMEEIDLCWRLHAAGKRIYCIPESVVYHAGGGSLPYESEFKTYLNFRNNLFLLYKNLPLNKLQKTIFIRKVLDGVAGLRFLFTGQFRNIKSILRAHADFRKKIAEGKIVRVEAHELEAVNNVLPFLNKSVVFEFFLKRKTTYNKLLL